MHLVDHLNHSSVYSFMGLNWKSHWSIKLLVKYFEDFKLNTIKRRMFQFLHYYIPSHFWSWKSFLNFVVIIKKNVIAHKKNQIDLSPFIVFIFITILTSRINIDKNSNVDPYTPRCSPNSHIELNKSSVSLGICQEYKERWKSWNRGAMNTELVDKYVYVIVAATELSEPSSHPQVLL